MAKSQLKQNQSYLIKLKIVKVVINLEIIQPQLGNYSTTISDRPTLFSFWQKKIKKSKMGNPFSLKRENDVSKDKSIFDSYHVVIFTHWLRLFHLYISLFA